MRSLVTEILSITLYLFFKKHDFFLTEIKKTCLIIVLTLKNLNYAHGIYDSSRYSNLHSLQYTFCISRYFKLRKVFRNPCGNFNELLYVFQLNDIVIEYQGTRVVKGYKLKIGCLLISDGASCL